MTTMTISVQSTDVLILGGGIAALRAAVAAAQRGVRVTVLRKGPPGLGVVAFNAAVPDGADSPAQFFNDMMAAAEFLGDPHLVAVLTAESWGQVGFLEGLGLALRKADGSYAPRLTSGHSIPRTVYTTDRTGPDIIGCLHRWLREHCVSMHHDRQAIALLKARDSVAGALVVNRKDWTLEACTAGSVVLATGGLGPLYAVSTNPPDLSGDGYALAYQAGAELVDMEFVQYEPFVILAPPRSRGFTVSFLLADSPAIYDADRQEFLPDGGKGKGKEFLARAVYQQVRDGRGSPSGGVYFDLRGVPPEKIAKHPRFVAACKAGGVDPTATPIEVGPAQHYMMGGVRIDERGATAVPGLFAAGEVAGGVHGANRLAGNSGTDVLVFGARAGHFAAEYAASQGVSHLAPALVEEQAASALPSLRSGSHCREAADDARARLQGIMWDQVGLIRNGRGLTRALEAIQSLAGEAGELRADSLADQFRLLELRHHLLLSEMICRGALLREESRGAHYREDFPARDDVNWLKSIFFVQSGGRMQVGLLRPSREREDMGS